MWKFQGWSVRCCVVLNVALLWFLSGSCDCNWILIGQKHTNWSTYFALMNDFWYYRAAWVKQTNPSDWFLSLKIQPDHHYEVFKALLFLVSFFNQLAVILRSSFIILTCFIFHVQLRFSEISEYIRWCKVKAVLELKHTIRCVLSRF